MRVSETVKPELFSLSSPTNSETTSKMQQTPTASRTRPDRQQYYVLVLTKTSISAWLSKGRFKEQDTEGVASFSHTTPIYLKTRVRSPCNCILMPPRPQSSGAVCKELNMFEKLTWKVNRRQGDLKGMSLRKIQQTSPTFSRSLSTEFECQRSRISGIFLIFRTYLFMYCMYMSVVCMYTTHQKRALDPMWL